MKKVTTTRLWKAIALSTIVTFGSTSCMTTDAYTGQQKLNKTSAGAGLGALAGAGLGAIIGNNTGDGDSGRGALIGAAAGAALGGGIGNYMDRQEAAIRQQLQGTGVSVTREGDNIILNMPENITFDVARTELRPQFLSTLDSVAIVLKKFDRTQVEIAGHTDSDGDSSYNQRLSEGRALSVANYLSSQQVNPQRLVPRGYGESQPIASNASSAGKAQNRRVEVSIIPQQARF